MRAGEQRDVVLRLNNADGVEAVDLRLEFDPAEIRIVQVRAVELGGGFSLASHQQPGRLNVAMYGLLPLEGSGALLSVTVAAVCDLERGSTLELDAELNEGRIPLRVVNRTPRGPRPERRSPRAGRSW